RDSSTSQPVPPGQPSSCQTCAPLCVLGHPGRARCNTPQWSACECPTRNSARVRLPSSFLQLEMHEPGRSHLLTKSLPFVLPVVERQSMAPAVGSGATNPRVRTRHWLPTCFALTRPPIFIPDGAPPGHRYYYLIEAASVCALRSTSTAVSVRHYNEGPCYN